MFSLLLLFVFLVRLLRRSCYFNVPVDCHVLEKGCEPRNPAPFPVT